MKSIVTGAFLLIFMLIESCGPDNRVSARFRENRVIKNISDYAVSLKLFFDDQIIQESLESGDSLALFADCEVRGGDKGCGNPDYSFAFVEGLEDSVHFVFNNEKILRFNREYIGPCCERNILVREEQWGYAIDGEGTTTRTYTYAITNEDYDNAEPIDG